MNNSKIEHYDIVIVGGGAAGFFAAANLAGSGKNVAIVEASPTPLDKVKISGGGRCNVTHNCFSPALLVKNYPRGERELRSPFSRFQPEDTIKWFESRGVKLKVEEDGRMFPTTDDSLTILRCLRDETIGKGVKLYKETPVAEIRVNQDSGFELRLFGELFLKAKSVLLATGGSITGHRLATELGHRITDCVPSLFTFKINDERLDGLAGLSVSQASVSMRIGKKKIGQTTGPVLITHWGLSGPAILKLSSISARALAGSKYRGIIKVDWLPVITFQEMEQTIQAHCVEHPRKGVRSDALFRLPKRIWERLVVAASITDELTWSHLKKSSVVRLIEQLKQGEFQVEGKGKFKDEFVTCGGVALKEVDFKTMESKIQPGLYLAGEILDIDGFTGGFNFQSAWTTGWLAAQSMAGE